MIAQSFYLILHAGTPATFDFAVGSAITMLCPPIIHPEPIDTLCFVQEPIPISTLSPTTACPANLTPGARLVKLPIEQSWPIEQFMFITTKSMIRHP